jgi:hypothetical protein
MKKIYFVLFVALGFLSTVNVNAQTNVTSSGMSIQGIARDETNAALSNIDQLDLVFTVYYLGSGNSEQTILTKSATVKTDNFGVFSYVLTIDQDQYTLISTNSAYLKVVQGSVVFSNEKLQAVPYAIYAQNGVPTGTVVAYIGTTAPTGWMFCDGTPIPNTPYYANLKAMLGNATTTPGLKAMFLRGAGIGNGKTGPNLMQGQGDTLGTHNHGVNINTNAAGAHNHSVSFGNDDFNGSGGSNRNGLEDDTTGPDNRSLITSSANNHTHNVSGNTSNTGDAETRPINWGVNWIIKI